ncbi:TKL protein kinase [Saprolegnia diclina VS20]|uniref:TKL protein kinase n=1 Tax=Saprolegnia diclina (strain VS20) TaxID=1156394 RepID=T0SET8_SAPDV|nr:TKL protein kinase [Saprolegnia diclina VS20]EQC41447.1 TKL protein kinase [Saprolegnia diclina VS20]|eukprot:XP_008605161.1 TKL protein kinase [Saprolegnia diclina VS20]
MSSSLNVVATLRNQAPQVATYAPTIAPPDDVVQLLATQDLTWASLPLTAKNAVLWALGYVRAGASYYKVYTRKASAPTMERIQIAFADLSNSCNPDSPCGQNKVVTRTCPVMVSMLKCAVDPTSGIPSSATIPIAPSGVLWGWTDGGSLKSNITLTANTAEGMPYSIHLNADNDLCGSLAVMSSTVPCALYTAANAALYERPQPPPELTAWLQTLQSTATTAPAPVTLAPPAASSSISTGAIIGIAIGVVAVLLLLVFFCRRRRQHKAPKDAYLEVDDVHLSLQEVDAANQRLGEAFPDLALFQVDSAISLKRLDYTSVHFERRLASADGYDVLVGFFDQTRVTIKRLASDARRPSENLVVFTDAVRIMAGINHPQMTAVVGVGWDLLENLCIVTEFMPHGSLRDALDAQLGATSSGGKKARQPASPAWTWKNEKLAIAMDIAKALVYLHTLEEPTAHAGLTSRDVFLVPGPPLSAKVNSAALHPTPLLPDSNGATMTNLEWTAPEVLTGHAASLAADIYAFGILLCELDTCALPYSEGRSSRGRRSETTQSNLLQRIVKDGLRPELSSSSTQPLRELIALCVDKDPSTRPTAMMLVFHLRSKVKPSL